MFGLEEVEPFPVPKSPAMMQQTPSVKIPLKINQKSSNSSSGSLSSKTHHQFPSYLLMACIGGVVAPDRRAQA